MSSNDPYVEVSDLRIFAAVVLRGSPTAIEEIIRSLKREGPSSGVRVLFVKASGSPIRVVDGPPKEISVVAEEAA